MNKKFIGRNLVHIGLLGTVFIGFPLVVKGNMIQAVQESERPAIVGQYHLSQLGSIRTQALQYSELMLKYDYARNGDVDDGQLDKLNKSALKAIEQYQNNPNEGVLSEVTAAIALTESGIAAQRANRITFIHSKAIQHSNPIEFVDTNIANLKRQFNEVQQDIGSIPSPKGEHAALLLKLSIDLANWQRVKVWLLTNQNPPNVNHSLNQYSS